jgi:flagellar biosynthesis/type III secretory pathway M-ring protein FliF/YscJ
MEEQKEKEGWIKKYEVINDEKNDWIKKFYSLKSYLLVFIILFVLSTTALVLKIINIY